MSFGLSLGKADLILENGRVTTFDPARPDAEAIAIAGGRILAVGHLADVRGMAGSAARHIDCGGGSILPGFHDPHLHVTGHINSILGVDCSGPDMRCIADLQAGIMKRAAETPPGSWIRAWGYHEFHLAEGRHPTRWELDAAAPGHPVRLLHRSGHACVLNSRALEAAGIRIDTPEPPGGVIDRDLESGEPNGVLIEMGAYLLARSVPPMLSRQEFERGVRLANQIYLSRGMTTIHDATAHNGLADWATFQDFVQAELLQPRTTMMAGVEEIGHFIERGMITGWGDDRLRIGAVKVVLDESTGRLQPPPAVLREIVLLAHRSGFQLAIHAVEARQVAAAVEAIAEAQRVAPRADARHRIEHASVCPPSLVEQIRQHGIAVVSQPAFVYHNGERYLAQVPDEDLPHLYRLRSLVDAGIALALSSDAPVVPPDPLVTVMAAVTRRTGSGLAVNLVESLSLIQALYAATAGAALLNFSEARLGRLAPGYLADLVILNHNIFTRPAEEIGGVGVGATLLGGRVLWEH